MTKSRKLFIAFTNALRSSNSGTREDQRAHFIETMRSDQSYLVLLADSFFDREYAKWKTEEVAGSTQVVGTSPVQDRAEAARHKRDRTERVGQLLVKVAKRYVDMVTLDLIMPNGKRLRDCTGAEIHRFGGIYINIAKTIKPTQVLGNYINAAELAAVVSRSEKKAA